MTHEEEIQNRVEEAADQQVSTAGEMNGQSGEALVSAGKDSQNGVDDIIHQGVRDGLEGAAHDDAHCHVHHISPGNKLLEFGDQAGGFRHKQASFPCELIKARDDPQDGAGSALVSAAAQADHRP